jgi:hypothetical protein
MRWSFYAIFMRKLVSNQPCWVTGGTDRKVKKKIFFFRGRHNFLYRSELVLGIGSLLSLSVYTYISIYMCKCIYAYIRIYKIYVYIYIFFAALEFQLRVSWFLGRCSASPFCVGYFPDVSWTICLRLQGWLRTPVLLISVSWVARITGLSHRCPA